MDRSSPVFVAGGETLIGSAVLRALERAGFDRLTGWETGEVDLTDSAQVDAFFASARPAYVFLAAGRSGGIAANTRCPADLMLDNLTVQTNVIHAAHRHGVEKLLYLASSCCYPRDCPQPMREEYLLTGPLEPTNEAYATAKIAGIKLCRAFRKQHGDRFICAIPANAFGPGDDFSLEDSHVVAALLRRMHEARLAGAPEVEVWGTGKPKRDFIYADDLAEACLLLMEKYDEAEPVNVGSSTGISIAEAAYAAKEVVGYEGTLRFNADRPDGMPIKILDCRKVAALGWRPRRSFSAALKETYEWYLQSRFSTRETVK